MYNDYYLQQIDNKLYTTNQNLNEILEKQQTLISGDIEIKNKIEENSYNIFITNILIMLAIIFYLIIRCFK